MVRGMKQIVASQQNLECGAARIERGITRLGSFGNGFRVFE